MEGDRRMTKERIHKQASDLYTLVCQNARVEGFPFSIVLDAIDRARDRALHHIQTQEYIRSRQRELVEPETYDLEHDSAREWALIEGEETDG